MAALTSSEPPPGRAAGLHGPQRCGGLRAKPVHEPWWRARGGSAELGRQSPTRFIDLGRPAFGRPAGRHGGHGWWIGDLPGLAFYDEIELLVATLSAQRGSRPRFLALRFRSPDSNQKAPSTNDAPMPVTCGLPSGLIVVSQQL